MHGIQTSVHYGKFDSTHDKSEKRMRERASQAREGKLR